MEYLEATPNNSTKIPGLDPWTNDQLAYIQFARMKCSKSTAEQKVKSKMAAIGAYRLICFSFLATGKGLCT